MHILIVDDNAAFTRAVERFLTARGHTARTARDGVEAVEHIQVGRPDLAICDIRMPRMDGHDLLRWIRRSAPGLPVILVTGQPSVDSAVEALRQGADDYLTKPLDLEELGASIERARSGVNDDFIAQ